jgi:hypothetical protein
MFVAYQFKLTKPSSLPTPSASAPSASAATHSNGAHRALAFLLHAHDPACDGSGVFEDKPDWIPFHLSPTEYDGLQALIQKPKFRFIQDKFPSPTILQHKNLP